MARSCSKTASTPAICPAACSATPITERTRPNNPRAFLSRSCGWGAARQRIDGRLQAGDELAEQLRPAEDPGGRRQKGRTRQSVDEMPWLRADAVLSRARS